MYPFHIYLRSLKGKVVHLTLTLSQDLQVFMSQCTPPTFPFTSALPISFNRPVLFGRGEKSNAKKNKQGNLCSNFSQGWTFFYYYFYFIFYLFYFFFFAGKLGGGEKKIYANFRGTYAHFFTL